MSSPAFDMFCLGQSRACGFRCFLESYQYDCSQYEDRSRRKEKELRYFGPSIGSVGDMLPHGNQFTVSSIDWLLMPPPSNGIFSHSG
jgi:hypothetical protein